MYFLKMKIEFRISWILFLVWTIVMMISYSSFPLKINLIWVSIYYSGFGEFKVGVWSQILYLLDKTILNLHITTNYNFAMYCAYAPKVGIGIGQLAVFRGDMCKLAVELIFFINELTVLT